MQNSFSQKMNNQKLESDHVLKEMTMCNQDVNELVNALDLELATDSDDAVPLEEKTDEKQQTIAEPHCKYTPTINQFFAGLVKKGMFLWGRLDERIHTGFHSFDNLFQGWQRGYFSVIAAAPGNNLKLFVWNVIGNLVKTQGNNTCAFISTRQNMSSDELRHIANNIFGYGDSCSSVRYNDEEIRRIGVWYCELSQEERLKLPSFFYNTTPYPTLHRIEEWIKDLVENSGINCVFIDSLEEICWAEPKRNEVMKYVCYKLKELAAELHIAIIVTSELDSNYYEKKRIEIITNSVVRLDNIKITNFLNIEKCFLNRSAYSAHYSV